MSIRIRVLTKNRPDRVARMVERFRKIGIAHFNFFENITIANPNVPEKERHVWDCMFGHLSMLREFISTRSEFGILCEDDVHLRTGFCSYLPELTAKMIRLDLDVLLLGYLTPYPLVRYESLSRDFTPLDTLHILHYPDTLWGSQMYLLRRSYAQQIVDTYTSEYALRTVTDPSLTPFSADWIITKKGKRALVYPMLAVEEGVPGQPDSSHAEFHAASHRSNFNNQYV